MTDKAAIYVRVSTEEQANPEKTSLASQQERCRAYCQAMEWEVVELYEDPGISGTLEPALRPALSRLLGDAAEGRFKRIVFLKIDRLARNLRKLLNLSHELDGSGVGLVSVEEQFDTSTASGRLYFNLLGAFAEFEAEQIKERMTSGRRAAVSQKGKYLSSKAPYGYFRENGHIKKDNQEAKVVRQIYRLAMAGTGLKTIAETLNKQGVPPPNADAKSEKRRAEWWWHTTVHKILKARRYIGEGSYAGTLMRCPVIIDPETFDAVQRALPRRKKDSPRNTKHFYLLQHLVYCRYCATHFPDETGHRYSARTVKTRGGRVAYICRRRQQWGKKAGHEGIRWTWSGDVLDKAIKLHLLRVIADEDYLVQEAKVYIDEAKCISQEQDEMEERLATQIAKLEDQERRVLEGWERGVYQDQQQAQERLATVRAELEETKAKLEQLRRADRPIELTRAEKVRVAAEHARSFGVIVERGVKAMLKPRMKKGWEFEALAEVEKLTAIKTWVPDPIDLLDEEGNLVEGAPEPKQESIPLDQWWRDLVESLIDRIWVEDDGRHLTVEGIIEAASDKLEVVPDDRRTR